MLHPITFEPNPKAEDIQVLGNGIIAYAKQKTKHTPMEFFAFFVRDAQQKIIGGCNGSTLYGCLYIDQLWVDESIRQQGYGRHLVNAALAFGVEKHCSFATVNTMSWEALGFYQKLGFEIEFQRTGFEHGSIFYFLRKSLAPVHKQHNNRSQCSNSMLSIQSANIEHISQMVTLSKEKRLNYEKAQPQFWRHADDAETQQTTWFHELLQKDNYLLKVAHDKNQFEGFIIGCLRKAPEVYHPGGLTLEIDDFCVNNNQWHTIGTLLLDAVVNDARNKGAVQILVVCGAHDEEKKRFLKNHPCVIASEWYISKI